MSKDGPGDYISDVPDEEFGTGDFTLEFCVSLAESVAKDAQFSYDLGNLAQQTVNGTV